MDKAAEIVKILRSMYPGSRVALKYKNPLQLLVATMLAAQCTDKKVNEITPFLFKRYPSAEAFAEAEREDLEEIIRPTGFYRAKAGNIINSARMIRDEFGGEVPDSMAALVKLPGVARKTANVVLSSAFSKAEGIAVDTHVKRLSARLGLSWHTNPDRIEQDLMRKVPRKDWLDFNYLMVAHGRALCTARAPKCPECALKNCCVFFSELKRQSRGGAFF